MMVKQQVNQALSSETQNPLYLIRQFQFPNGIRESNRRLREFESLLMPMRTSYEKLVSIAFVLALALVLGVGAFSYNAIRSMIAADRGRNEARKLLVARGFSLAE